MILSILSKHSLSPPDLGGKKTMESLQQVKKKGSAKEKLIKQEAQQTKSLGNEKLSKRETQQKRSSANEKLIKREAQQTPPSPERTVAAASRGKPDTTEKEAKLRSQAVWPFTPRPPTSKVCRLL
ncbi:hypothetical protein AVEN_67482-1 [Araneus ventricosus]|uniref:Uncharacterized protein n=1 Tax=Araneus ventricosus TaxID=182803 RepID=A0A4Y2WJS9_ARAVE|nr:hypothetical protein AVEN_67482-1 [Araneus ventricosus]